MSKIANLTRRLPWAIRIRLRRVGIGRITNREMFTHYQQTGVWGISDEEMLELGRLNLILARQLKPSGERQVFAETAKEAFQAGIDEARGRRGSGGFGPAELFVFGERGPETIIPPGPGTVYPQVDGRALFEHIDERLKRKGGNDDGESGAGVPA